MVSHDLIEDLSKLVAARTVGEQKNVMRTLLKKVAAADESDKLDTLHRVSTVLVDIQSSRNGDCELFCLAVSLMGASLVQCVAPTINKDEGVVVTSALQQLSESQLCAELMPRLYLFLSRLSLLVEQDGELQRILGIDSVRVRALMEMVRTNHVSRSDTSSSLHVKDVVAATLDSSSKLQSTILIVSMVLCCVCALGLLVAGLPMVANAFICIAIVSLLQLIRQRKAKQSHHLRTAALLATLPSVCKCGRTCLLPGYRPVDNDGSDGSGDNGSSGQNDQTHEAVNGIRDDTSNVAPVVTQSSERDNRDSSDSGVSTATTLAQMQSLALSIGGSGGGLPQMDRISTVLQESGLLPSPAGAGADEGAGAGAGDVDNDPNRLQLGVPVEFLETLERLLEQREGGVGSDVGSIDWDFIEKVVKDAQARRSMVSS